MEKLTSNHLLRNHYAIITGACGGMGTSFALECAARGYDLFLVDMNGESLYRLCDFVKRNFPVKVNCVEGDIAEEETPQKVIELVLQEEMKVKMLVNCAGIGQNELFEDTDERYLRKLIEVNAIGCVSFTKALLPELKRNSRSYIINVSSLASFYPLPRKSCYAATKGFVRQFSQALNVEVKKYGVHVSVLCPGPVVTTADGYIFHKHVNWFTRQMMQTARAVVVKAINDTLKGKEIIIPGRLNRILRFISGFVPRFLQKRLTLYSMKQLERKKATVKKILRPELQEAASIPA